MREIYIGTERKTGIEGEREMERERERASVREGRDGDGMECEALSIWDAP